jgi:hypothetical protein
LFRNKDTNYGAHVDWAWLWFDAPFSLPMRFAAGRQPFVVGNRLVLDPTYDGVRVDSNVLAGGVSFSAFWAKVHEGDGSMRNPVGLLMNDDDGRADGDLLGVSLRRQSDAKATHKAELFGLPDVEGISPQGLGSPVSRGYRELENTTVAMLTFGANLHRTFRVEAAYAFLRATQPIYGWDAKGPTDVTSQDIGQEVDLNLKWQLAPGLSLVGLYGVFLPGYGAALLINGNLDHKAMAWEAKHGLMWAFRGAPLPADGDAAVAGLRLRRVLAVDDGRADEARAAGGRVAVAGLAADVATATAGVEGAVLATAAAAAEAALAAVG